MGQLAFYIKHSLNDLRVNGRRTLFALLCIAAGVAAIVSLQTLGIMIEDTLTGSLRETNRGDIRIFPFGNDFFTDPEARQNERIANDGIIAQGQSEFDFTFTPHGIATLKNGWQKIMMVKPASPINKL